MPRKVYNATQRGEAFARKFGPNTALQSLAASAYAAGYRALAGDIRKRLSNFETSGLPAVEKLWEVKELVTDYNGRLK